MIERGDSGAGIAPVWEFPQDPLKLGFIQDRVKEELSEMHSMGYSRRQVANFQSITADTIYRCSELLGVPGPMLRIGSGRASNGLLYDALSSWLPDETHIIDLSPMYLRAILTGEWKRYTSGVSPGLRERILQISKYPVFSQLFLDAHPANVFSHELHHSWNRINFPEQSIADGEVFASGADEFWRQTTTERGACEFSRLYIINQLSVMDKSKKKTYLDLMI